MLRGETVHSPLPQDLPWWMPDHFVFFGVLYAVLGIIGLGLAWTFYKSWKDVKEQPDH
ncbi:hypothetical protein [Desulfovibrio oxyclinae]|jgi:acyl-coenzyme A synthetase/AMP-(fatty) acid ligase|uniref:hypothetical protein n=1 Tax=Desulfovibrio oxyclinae TaxID=63560 RepID=UPI00036F00B3|nr:hypothetical protein [Desulfovibrio oxyclinae]